MSVFTAPAQATDPLGTMGGGDGLAAMLNALDTAIITGQPEITPDKITITEGTTDANSLNFGDDCTIYRQDVNQIRTNDQWICDNLVTIGGDGASSSNLNFYNGLYKINWGDSAGTYDTNLYRDGANSLRTDDIFTAFGVSVSNGDLTIYNSTGKINFGDGAGVSDTNLYRSAANTLKTDDKLLVGTQGTTDESVVRIGDNGWMGVSDTWTYASATTITVPTDATTKYSKGDKIRLKQGGGYKYFYITNVAATTLTVTGGSDYSVANSAITDNYYSKAPTPVSFPDQFNYVPTLTNLTLGNGSLEAQFKIVENICSVYFRFTLGSTSAVGTNPYISQPVANSSNQSGTTIYSDSGSNRFFGHAWIESSNRINPTYNGGVGYSILTATVPFTWTTNDYMAITINYKI